MSQRIQPFRKAHVAAGSYEPEPEDWDADSDDTVEYTPCEQPARRTRRDKTPDREDGNVDFDTEASKKRLKEREGSDCAITKTSENKDISIFDMDYITRAHFLEKCWLYWLVSIHFQVMCRIIDSFTATCHCRTLEDGNVDPSCKFKLLFDYECVLHILILLFYSADLL